MKNKKLKSCFFLGVCAISILSFTQKTKAATDTEANVNTTLELPYRIADDSIFDDGENEDVNDPKFDVNPKTSSKDIHFFGQTFEEGNSAKYMMIPNFNFGNVEYKGKEVVVPAQKLKYTLNNGNEYEGYYMEYALYNYNPENKDDFNFYVSIAPFISTKKKELKGSKLSIRKDLFLLNGDDNNMHWTNDSIGGIYTNDNIETNSETIHWLNKDSIDYIMNTGDWINKTRLLGSDIIEMNLTIPSNTTIEDGTKYTSTWTWTTEANPIPPTEIQYDGYWGTAPYTFDKDTGELIVYSGELAGYNVENGENGTGGYIGKQLNINDIKSVKFVGNVVAQEDSSQLFYDWGNMKSFDGTNLDTSNVTSMSWMFYNCSSLTNIDVSNWDTANVTDMNSMFTYCSSLTSIDVSNWDTANVTDMGSMFESCSSLTNIDVSNWDTFKVTSMVGMFNYCQSLTNIDVSNWDTSNVTDMGGMFFYCSSLTNLDVSNWDTANVTSMSSMFYLCTSLTSIDVSNWDTSKVTDMYYMFWDCQSLTNIDVSNWDTSKVTNMDYMFKNTTKLDKLTLGETFKFKKGTSLSGTWQLESNPEIQFRESDWVNYNGATDSGTYIKIAN